MKAQHLELDDHAYAEFDRTPFTFRHNLAQHPLFDLDRLLALSRGLPGGCAEFYKGDVPVALRPELTPSTGLSLQETIRTIERCGSWVVLKGVERDPEYRALLDRCLEDVEDACAETVPEASDRVGFIFISSARSITPCHLDPENNFLLQISGTKTIHIAPHSLLAPEDLERYFTGGHRNVTLPEGFESRAGRFALTPGEGVHVPFTAPHWVVNGDDVSVSFSVTFQTPQSRRRAILHKVNAHLRRTGIVPAAPGRSRIRDTIKVCGFEAVRRARKLARIAATRHERPGYA
jgi:hypothetical protein